MEVSVKERENSGVAAIVVRAGKREALAVLFDTQLGLKGSYSASIAANKGLSLWGTAPGAWLLLEEGAPRDWVEGVALLFDGVAGVFDQSDAYVFFRLEGDGAEAVLQKGLFIDLHSAQFPPGTCACGPIAQVNVIVARLAQDRFDVAVPRSYVERFRHWLDEAAGTSDIRLRR